MSGAWWVSEADLDTDQASAVQGIPEDASFLIKGPAGSGKTNILLLRAKWLRLIDKSHQKLIVFTRTLRDFIREGCTEYGIPREDVVTSVQFFHELLSEYQVSSESTGNFETDRTLLGGKVQTLIESKKIEGIYDALLVDECQDYTDTELLIFKKLAVRLILVADSRQSIYRTTQTENLLEKLTDGNVVNLKYHYRSGLKICRVADAILRDSANFAPVCSDSLYDEKAKPSSVELVLCPTLESQFKAILERIPSQLDAYPGELIGVLFPKREQVAGFIDELTRRTLGEELTRVRVDTMHGGKGLEFRAVHLGGCEALYRMGATQKRLIYTSILRGQTSVALYFSGNIPGYLESAAARNDPPKSKPLIGDLFKRK
jgi:superfamily I DNA/RNA helicase